MLSSQIFSAAEVTGSLLESPNIQRQMKPNGVARRHRSVLVIEDERVSRRALTMLLSRNGYPTEAVATGEEAMRLIKRGGQRPEILLVDLDLPGMNGLDLIAQVAVIDPSATAIMITASGDDSIAGKLSRLGAAYLRKPLDFDALMLLLGSTQPNDSKSGPIGEVQ